MNSSNPETKSLIIFDWDDTLYPTTIVIYQNNWIKNQSIIPEKIKKSFSILEFHILALLDNAKKYGEVLIITNSQPGWVKDSCKLMPKLLQVLDTIQIISAQHEWIHLHPNRPDMWKKNAFLKLINDFINFDPNLIVNLICIGDSIHEHDASKYSSYIINTSSSNNVYVKNIIFESSPSINQLINEIYYTNLLFDVIINEDKSLEFPIISLID
jgi:hypothetical protein